MSPVIVPQFLPIPDGDTWQDSTGRTWTAHGSLRLDSDSIQSVRQDLFDYLRFSLSQWQWYDYPPDQVKAPFVALSPSDPYILPSDMGGPSSLLWGFELTMGTQRGKTDEGLRRLEFMFTETQEVLRSYTGAEGTRWLEFGDIGTTTIGDVEYLTGVYTLAVIDKVRG